MVVKELRNLSIALLVVLFFCALIGSAVQWVYENPVAALLIALAIFGGLLITRSRKRAKKETGKRYEEESKG